MTESLKPVRTVAECNALLDSPGSAHETEYQIVDGRVTRVYKNLLPNIRSFWLKTCSDFSLKTCLIYENERYSYADMLQLSASAASMFRNQYDVQKGDRVTIVSRNFPEFLIAFWGAQLIGAVVACVNAWIDRKSLNITVMRTRCKVLLVDEERLDLIDTQDLLSTTNGFIALRASKQKVLPIRYERWEKAIESQIFYQVDTILSEDVDIHPDDDAVILYTSGTTGLPKGVLTSQRGYLSSTLNTLVGRTRALLRSGETSPPPATTDEQKGMLVPTPLFHVSGLSALSLSAFASGMKVALMTRWDAEEASRLMVRENISTAGGVPSMLIDLLDTSASSSSTRPNLQGIVFGGAPSSDTLVRDLIKAFPSAILSQIYGATETNGTVISHAGLDYTMRPTSVGLPCPIIDVVVVTKSVSSERVAKPFEKGEIWVRGASVMRGYWDDPEATSKVLTKDGWFKTGDVGYVDQEGFVFMVDREKDIIIRGGENVDSTVVENALYADPRILEAAAVGIPDRRLGELVAAIITLKKEYESTEEQRLERELLENMRDRLPKFALPIMIVVSRKPLEKNPSHKIIKAPLRILAGKEWEKRQGFAKEGSKL